MFCTVRNIYWNKACLRNLTVFLIEIENTKRENIKILLVQFSMNVKLTVISEFGFLDSDF